MARGYLSEDKPLPEEIAEKKAKRRRKEREDSEEPIIGVDGEGQDTPDGGHIYTYLAAVDENGKLVADAWNERGLSLDECARMLLTLPKKALKFGFMFSYDVTKIAEQLPLVDRYYLMRPSLRDEAVCTECRVVFPSRTISCSGCAGELRQYTRRVRYRGRSYDYFNGSFSVAKGRTSIKVWDCFRFFGCAFVEAVKDWNGYDPDGTPRYELATKEQLERISAMKLKRGSFDVEEPEQIQRYCQDECHVLAKMMRKVKKAHDDAGIPLTSYYGAGSTATALLRANEVAAHKGPRHSDLSSQNDGIGHAIAAAFFGGRFEDSMVGIIREPVFGFDIASAYPFAQTFMPCLACGTWRRETRMTPAKLKKARVAVAAYRVKPLASRARKSLAWGPLPFRDEKGSISYGLNFTGWAWGPELVAALKGWPDLVELTGEAWTYETVCDHKPFEFLPKVYRQRVEWGKEGAGKALKLGMNAGYGKTAQSIGDDPPFQSWTWAGLTTATARGQILDAIASAKDRWNVLTIATDGIYALEDLPLNKAPKSTGTGDLPKPLGCWERKAIPDGVFVVKPGLYYKLGADLADVRARGIGRREVHAAMPKLEAGFLAWDRANVEHHVPLQSRRFYGAKHSILARSSCRPCGKSWPGVPEHGCPSCGKVGDGFETSEAKLPDGRAAYGLWGLRDVKIGFDPYPKRERHGIARRGTSARLHVRDLGGGASAPYDVGAGTTTPEGEAMRLAKEIQLEQPDWEEVLRDDG